MTEQKAENVSAKSKIYGHVHSKSGAILNGSKITCEGFKTLALADGLYVFDDLPHGTFEVRANLQGFQSETKKVTVAENEIAVLDFRLSAAVGTARIRGRVYDSETGKPIAKGGTIILILPISNRYTKIEADGYYEFASLPAGTYRISTSITEYKDADAVLAVTDGELKTHDFFCKIKKVVEPAWG